MKYFNSAVIAAILAIFLLGCGSAAADVSSSQEDRNTNRPAADKSPGSSSLDTGQPLRSTIEIAADSPADVVRRFYNLLREKKFREAIYLTNLKPAIEALSDAELKEFQTDFERVAATVPAEVVITGQVISGNRATVTARIPDADGLSENQEIALRRDGDDWIILSVDEAAEARIKKEGRQYFFNLRIETHEDEARDMLDRVSRAELAYALQNGGVFADLETLIKGGLLPEDIRTSDSTGYNFAIELAPDKKSYKAFATPAEYGKSGRLSFLLASDGKQQAKIISRDMKGARLENP
jgi:hypothetical protein